MIPVMVTTNDAGVQSPSDGEKEPSVASTSASNFNDTSDETRVSDSLKDPRVSKLENDESRSGGGDNQPSSSGKLDHNKYTNIVEEYNTLLSAFDDYIAKENCERIGHGCKLGDMVWGKVKSHPWWPGHIYNEALASASVRRDKTEGHVLVAFFGDNSYGWFDPAELIPFEENFAEKCRQASFLLFLKAVEEAVDELSRRSSLGLTCRCRNEFNFWPSNVEGYFVVDVGDQEGAVYGSSQISEARNNFRPREMLSFVRQLALEPMNEQHSTIDFIKNKATVLACRKALFEEFDETYLQAFGSRADRPPWPTAPVSVDPSKGPLSGPLVIAEALGKGKNFGKPTKTKNHLENDKYLFKRRDEPIQIKSKKKASSGQGGRSVHPHGSRFSEKVIQTSESGVSDGQQESMASDIKSLEGGKKKSKVKKWAAGELISIEEKKKKKRKTEIALEKNVEKKDAIEVLSSSSQLELLMLVRDLRALALNPGHGQKTSRPDVIREVFLKYRSLVYQKSLSSTKPSENLATEGSSASRLLPPVQVVPAEEINNKILKPSVRLDDPTRGGRKRGPPDDLKNNLIKSKKMKMDDLRLLGVEKKIPQRSTDYCDVKETAAVAKNVAPSLQESSKKVLQQKTARGSANPTMLIMKFPSGAALPSGAELKAKFARFGPLHHSSTRIFWKSYTCRLVYHHRIDAEAAWNFASRNGDNLFGNINVRSHLREVGPEAAEYSESVKLDEQPRFSAQPFERRQLKSCLKSGKNGGGRGGSRVKFVNTEGEARFNENNKNTSVASFPEEGLDNNRSKKLPKCIHQSPSITSSSSGFQKFPNNAPPTTQQIPNDISQQMLHLLKRCSDVVNNLTGVLGYVPYHRL